MKLDKNQTTVLTWAGIITALGLLSWGAYELFFKKSIVDSELEKLRAKGLKPTITETNAQSIANNIDDELTNSLSYDITRILDLFNQISNLTDLFMVISKFGNRIRFSHLCYGSFSLPEYLNCRLSTKDLSLINDLLQSKNINYKF